MSSFHPCNLPAFCNYPLTPSHATYTGNDTVTCDLHRKWHCNLQPEQVIATVTCNLHVANDPSPHPASYIIQCHCLWLSVQPTQEMTPILVQPLTSILHYQCNPHNDPHPHAALNQHLWLSVQPTHQMPPIHMQSLTSILHYQCNPHRKWPPCSCSP